MRKPLLILSAIVVVTIAVTVAGLAFIPRLKLRAEVAGGLGDLLKSDADRVTRATDYYLDLTFATPELLKRVRLEEYIGKYTYGQPFLVSVNTHAGNIAQLVDLAGKMFLYDSDGQEYPAVGNPILTSVHHNTYVVIFPSVDHMGRSLFTADRRFFRIEVRDLPPFERRMFEWTLPIHSALAASPSPWAQWGRWLMVATALTAALAMTISPCAVNVGAFYSAVLTATLTHPTVAALPDRQVRPALVRVLVPFAVGYTVLFAAAGALIGWTGSVIQNPLAQLGVYWTLIRLLAAAVMVYFGLRLIGIGLGKLRQGRLTGAVGEAWRRAFLRVAGWITRQPLKSWPAASAATPFTPLGCLLIGVALSTECAICLGAGIFFPLAVYVGTTAWYWGMATLGGFALTLALPMWLLALGVRELRVTLPHRIRLVRALNLAAGGLMGFIGVELALGQDPHKLSSLVLNLVFGGTAWLYQ
ncbi:MAG TPA: hypothetical protein VNP04_16145 [Alphaproteobacteria bacterium]|nr:hypothetical protein [Alphaproteobacteria bacterium]